jgi:hypothetical protein
VGIGNTVPSSKLDVSGSATVRGTFLLPATGTSTSLKGFNSQALDLSASAFSSTTSTAVNQHFRWQAEPVGNDTASPTGKLNLLFGLGATSPAETGLSFSNTGNVTAKRLVSTIATGTSPLEVTSTTQVTNLNASLLGGLASSAFAKLNTSNSGNLSVTGSITGASFSGNGSGLSSVNAALVDGFSTAAFAFVGGNNVFTGAQTFAPTFPAPALTFADDGVEGDLQPTIIVNSVDCCDFGTRMIWAHSPAFPEWGMYYDDLDDIMIWQQTTGTNEMSLAFEGGDLDVTGTISAAAKDFKIDHPLDPTNKFLYHSSVESSEMMNIYTGNAILDNSGEGVVSLPKWFEALNSDFRYQLTAIGAAAPNLHIAEEIANHQFSISGGAPGMKVSWQVTGVRHDAYAKSHPLVVERKKSEKERGHYLHPEAYGAPRLTQNQMLAQRSHR